MESITVTIPVEDSEAPRKSRIFRNPQALDYYKSVFDQWDEDKDGFISVEELKRLIATNENINLSQHSISILYSKFDVNKDNQLDFDEFLEMINNPTFKSIFRKIARNYLKFVDIPKYRETVRIRRTLTHTGEYEKELTCHWYKIFMITISILQIILHHTNREFIEDITNENELGPIVLALRFDPGLKIQIYRYITYLLVHDPHQTVHVYGNVAFQILAGIPLEMVHGWRIIMIYLVGGIGGCLTHYILDGGWGLQGASAGVFSFYTAHVATVLLNWKEMVHPIFSLVVFAVLVFLNVIYNIVQIYIMQDTNKGDMTSHAAHFGGAVVGFLLGVIALRNLVVTKKETILCYICAVGFCIFMSTLIIFFIYYAVKDG